MLSSLVDGMCRQLMQKLSSRGERLSYFELTHHDTDEVIVKIFQWKHEARFQKEKERMESGPSGFDYHSSSVQKGISQYITELKKSYMFSSQDVESVIRESLLARINYIVKPLETAENMLFSGLDARAVDDIVQCMRDFEKYRYYPDALHKYAAAKNMTHLTKGQFRMLITEINQSLFNKNNLDNILKVCGLIMKEINDLRGQAEQSLPIDIMMEAFRDRSMQDFDIALNIEKELGNTDINLYGLRQVLSRFIILKDKEPSAEISRIPDNNFKTAVQKNIMVTTEKKPAFSDKTTGGIAVPPKSEEDSGELIDINQVLKTDKTGISQQVKTPAGAVETPAAEIDRDVTGEFIREELVSKFSDDTKTVKILNLKEAVTLEPLDTLIMPKDEKIFLKKIFSGDEAPYREFILRIDSAKRWKHAMAVIDEVLARRRVDPFCKEAIRLSDIVYQRYYPPAENP